MALFSMGGYFVEIGIGGYALTEKAHERLLVV